MFARFRSKATDQQERNRWLLSRAPWLWPGEQDGSDRERAIALSGRDEPPALSPGQVLLVAVGPKESSLWSLGWNAPHVEGALSVPFESDSVTAWQRASVAFPRSVPVLWRPVHELGARPPRPVQLTRRLLDGAQAAARDGALKGDSFGLPFVLAMASRVFEKGLPSDVAATGAVAPSGVVGNVGRLEAKLDILASDAPQVRRVLVPALQEEEARAHVREAGLELEIVPVPSAARALSEVFGHEGLLELLLSEGGTPERRSGVVRSLFRLVVAGRRAVVEWTAVKSAARLALKRWSYELDEKERALLQLSEAVAARHDANEPSSSPIGPDLLAHVPPSRRVELMAHFVQQSHDTGQPSADDAKAWAEPFRRPLDEAFTPHLRLEGALARLQAVTGDPSGALEIQENLARLYLDAFELADVSFSLCEWYRLAGVVGDAEALARAEAFRDEAEQLGVTDVAGPYVRLARARSRACLAELAPSPDVIEELRELSNDPMIPQHVRWSATRWLLRLRAEKSATLLQLQESRRRDLEAAARPVEGRTTSSSRTAARFRALVEIDAIVDGAGQRPDPDDARRRLEGMGEELIGHLLIAADDEADLLSHVAWHYPY